MSHYGRNPYPRRYGGGIREHEQEHLALLDAYAKGWDVSEGSNKWTEAYAHAVGVSIIWIINKRLVNQSQPMKMLENVTTYETVLELHPSITDTDVARRRRIAGVLRGNASNTIVDIYDACSALLGTNFDGLATVDPANEITYWPGVNPGPPGYEWSSNRCRIGVLINKIGINDLAYDSLRSQAAILLNSMLPAWMQFSIGTGTSFIVNQGLLGQTFL